MKISCYDAVILGGGPAGCSCALWLRHLGLNPLIIEKNDKLGGLQNESPYPNVWILGKNYPNGKAFARAVTKQISEEPISVMFNTEIIRLAFDQKQSTFRMDLKKGNKRRLVEANYFVLATGVAPRSGGFEPSSNVLIGPGDHVERAECRGKKVAILGGGDNAFENYQFIKRKKPKLVKIFARTVRAQLSFVKKVRRGDLHVGNYSVDIEGQKINGEVFDLLLIMYGWEGVNPVKSMIPLKMRDGFVETDEFRRTSVDGIYAIGEVTQASHPCCVTAMADGIIAAKDIQKRIDSIRVLVELKSK